MELGSDRVMAGLKPSPKYQKIWAANGGFFMVQLWDEKSKKPNGCDTITFKWKASNELFEHFITMREDEALIISRLLMWALTERMFPDIGFEDYIVPEERKWQSRAKLREKDG